MNVVVVGPGLVGKELIRLLLNFKNDRLTINIVGIMNSRKMVLGPKLLLKDLESIENGQPASLSALVSHCQSFGNGGILVDCTSNEEIAQQYPSLLEHLHIVTPNKKPFSSSQQLFDDIKAAERLHRKFCLHEATVGAGLPIISLLSDLILTGDEIVKIEGIFSGTLSFIFNTFSQPNASDQPKFSNVVNDAKSKGYTEPDPRDDLNGMDVARKTVILGRLSGKPMSVSSLPVENIVPKDLQSLDLTSFMSSLPNYDDYFAKLDHDAKAQGCVLRYVGCVDMKGESRVSLQKLKFDHPFAGLVGSENIVSFTTKYFPVPLIVRGAGAGATVTAFGIFSDILKIGKSIVGPF